MINTNDFGRQFVSEPSTKSLKINSLAVHRSRKRINHFHLHKPVSVSEAMEMLDDHPYAWIIAGGIDVINRMKCGETVEHVVSVTGVEPLRKIEVVQGSLHVGAACSHHDLATSVVVRRVIPALAQTWGLIANPRIRFKGTVGGNLMVRHPDYEGGAILAAVGGSLRFATGDGSHVVSCADHFSWPRQDGGWLLESVVVPFERQVRIVYDRSFKGVAGLVLGLILDGGSVVTARVATTWAYPYLYCRELPVKRMPLSKLALQAGALSREWAGSLPEPLTNHLASAHYRRRILEILLRRALERAGRSGVS